MGEEDANQVEKIKYSSTTRLDEESSPIILATRETYLQSLMNLLQKANNLVFP